MKLGAKAKSFEAHCFVPLFTLDLINRKEDKRWRK
jgi:hypothetical protein